MGRYRPDMKNFHERTRMVINIAAILLSLFFLLWIIMYIKETKSPKTGQDGTAATEDVVTAEKGSSAEAE